MIEIDLHKSMNTVNGKEVLRANTLIPENKITAVYGKSGTGKTTLLRMISGLTKPDHGILKLHDTTWFSSKENINIKTQRRNLGFVFQDYGLFPNMTVKQNITFGLKQANDPLVHKLLDETQLENLSKQYPNQLSGGQKQRVALARALVMQPKVLLMDEPLSALDIETRIKLRALILDLQVEYKMTTLLVSHDIPEIFSLAHRVLKIENNELIEYGTPKQAFDRNLLRKQFSALFDNLTTEE